MLKKLPISLFVVLSVLGILLSVQFQTQQIVKNTLKDQKPEDLAIMIENLTNKKYDLLRDRFEVTSQLNIFKNDTSKDYELAASMEKEINKLKAINGLYPVSGPGVSVTIYDTPTSSFTFDDLVRIINELWHLQGEAVAVNGIRVINSTVISERDFKITVNGQTLDFPIVIEAIGQKEKLERELNIPGGTLFLLQSPYFNNLQLDIKQEEELYIPEVKSYPIQFKYAKPLT